MALYSGRLLMRGGNESDFDPDKMIPREWAVSTDRKIVRICVSPGEVIRMATYDAFEEDMAKIENILKECQTIQEAVVRINAEVSQNADAVAEYTAQAKQYRDEAKTSADNAKTSETNSKTSETNAKASETNAKVSEEHAQAVFESLPEDYGTLSKEFYEVAIKQKASGEEIHVTDSANAKVREFALFGKAKQQTTSGNQLANLPDAQEEISGLKWSCKNGAVTVTGTSTGVSFTKNILYSIPIVAGTYFISGSENNIGVYITVTKANDSILYHTNKSFTLDGTEKKADVYCQVQNGVSVNATVYPMLNKGTTALPWEQFTGGQPSPSPEFPQEIEVPNGEVVVKSCGKNLLDVSEDGSQCIGNYYVNTSVYDYDITSNSKCLCYRIKVKSGNTYILSTTADVANMNVRFENINEEVVSGINWRNMKNYAFNIPDQVEYMVISFELANLERYKYQLELGEKSTPYEPYTETTATIPTTDFAGIPVSSGGNYTDSNGQQWICDEIVKYADGSGERIQRIWKEVFDGSEDEAWILNSGATIGNRYLRNHTSKMLRSDLTNGVKSLNSNFRIVENGKTWEIANCYTVSPESIMVSLNGTETLQEFKEYLASKPMTLLTALAEPIITPLTAEEIAEIEKLSMFYPVTNISNDADCGMSVTYLADSKLYIDNRLAQIEQALIANI